ncbi:hypothetical protein GIB67_020754, partial [Kingdonia uniflora]
MVGVVLPIQVKNIGFTGVFRLIFKPLVEEIPCVRAVSYSLRGKKKLNFTLKVVGGDLSSIPGLADAIEETITDVVEDTITWPVRKVIPIIPGNYSDLELKPKGTFEVKLVQAKELTNKDPIGKSDPYAKLYASELLGCAQVRLKDLEPSKVKDVWLKLVKYLDVQKDTKNRGQVHLELLYYPIGSESGFTNPFADNYSMTSLENALKSRTDGTEATVNGKIAIQRRKEVIARGVLSVTVISAEDLPLVDIMGKADPYVIVQMKKTESKNKSRVENDSLNPVWNQTFNFVVENGLHDMLILEVYDHDTWFRALLGGKKNLVSLTDLSIKHAIAVATATTAVVEAAVTMAHMAAVVVKLTGGNGSLTILDLPSRDSITAQRSTSSVSSGEVQSVVKPQRFHHDIDDEMFFAIEDSLQFYSATSRPGSAKRGGPFTPTKSKYSKSFYSGYSDHPNYMTNTESSRAKGRRCSPLPPQSSSGNSCILKDMFGTNVAYGTVQFNTTAPKGFYSVIIVEVIHEDACLYVESRTHGDVSVEFKANPGKLLDISIYILDI